MIETQLERAVDGHGAAETHTAEHPEFSAAFQQQTDDLQEILVPADGDPVFGDAAKTRHHAVVQGFVQLIHVANGTERDAMSERSDAGYVCRQGFDLQTIDSGDHVTVVHQVMREREARGPKPNHQHLVSRLRRAAPAA